MSPKIKNHDGRTIEYHLHQLGIRVSHDACQLISKKNANDWVPIGPPQSLPIVVPCDHSELAAMQFVDALIMTAYQYHIQQPGSDIVDVLSKKKSFAEAFADLRR